MYRRPPLATRRCAGIYSVLWTFEPFFLFVPNISDLIELNVVRKFTQGMMTGIIPLSQVIHFLRHFHPEIQMQLLFVC